MIVTQDLLLLGARIVADRNEEISSKGYFAADSANTGGFENLTLDGNMEFSGPISITLPGSLRVALGGTIRADSLVTLKAGHAALVSSIVGARTPGDPTLRKAFGGSFDPYGGPSGGNGSLQVEARLIETLKRLEYRGYDSAGVAMVADGRVDRRRARGKIQALEDVLPGRELHAANPT
jgi:hypothetical protein